MRDLRIVCEGAAEENDILYFPRFHGTGFYCYNKITSETKLLDYFENDETTNMRLYKSTIKVGQNLIFASSNGEAKIAIKNLENKTIKYIYLEEYLSKNGCKSDYFKFCDCVEYSDYIYFIGQSFPGIVRLDLKDYSIKIFNDWHAKLGKDSRFFFCNCYQKGDLLMLCCQESPNILIFNLLTEEYEILALNVDVSTFSAVAPGKNNDYWIFSRYEPFAYNVDSDGNHINKIQLFEPIEVDKMSYLVFPYVYGNGCYLFPVSTRNIYYFDFNTYRCEICNEFAEIVNREFCNQNGRLLNFQTREDYVYIIEVNSRLWHEINLNDRTYKTYDVFQDKDIILSEYKRGVIETNTRNLSHLIQIFNIK